TDVARSSRLRPNCGRTYGSRASRQKGRSPEGLALRASPIAAVVLRSEQAILVLRGPTTMRQYASYRVSRIVGDGTPPVRCSSLEAITPRRGTCRPPSCPPGSTAPGNNARWRLSHPGRQSSLVAG